jgi:hypothetical protein
MFDDCIGNEQWELARLHKISQQKSVLGSERDWIKYARLNVHPRASNGKSGGIQVSNATVRLKHVVLEGYQAQFLSSADQVRTISNEPQLKAIMLRRVGDD